METYGDIPYLHYRLTNVFDWSDKWQIRLSYSKCSVMFVGRTSCNANLSLNVNMLPVVDRDKDLGLIIDSHLTFSHHMDHRWSPHQRHHVGKIIQIESVQRRFTKRLKDLRNVSHF